MKTVPLSPALELDWEKWVEQAPTATLFHRLAWREVIADTFRHRPCYQLALDEQGAIRGILPFFVLRTGFFGTFGVSLPFLNYGGVAADSAEAAAALLEAARSEARDRGCRYVEFRHRHPLPAGLELPTNAFKVTSVLDLREGSSYIWEKKLHQNVRNKIRKGGKEGVEIRRGVEEFDSFYRVFAVNQRHHGTPVLPRRFFAAILRRLGADVHIFTAYRGGAPIGGKLTIDWRGTRHFIWSASCPEANRYAPVPAMNWAAIEDAGAAGLERVDFGRSTADSSSEKFKKYWGVETVPLYWQYHLLTIEQMPGLNTTNPKFEAAIRLWRRLPLWLTRWIGPVLARRLP